MGDYASPNELTTFSAPLAPSNDSDVFKNDASLRLARTICTQVLMPIVCVVGMAGNVLNIVVLTSATMRSSTSSCLCALAVYDLLYSLTGLPLTLRTYPSLKMSSTYMGALTYLLPLGNMWSNITTLLTCAFTIERFAAISTPIRSRKIFSIRRIRWNIVFISLPIAIITLPDFFKRKI
ncbi:Thyrotropin-releasing hormone receptor [Taenia solium]|eukprot:TsM_000898400 transcript=TsM_000898400 gene=TsM_000898400